MLPFSDLNLSALSKKTHLETFFSEGDNSDIYKECTTNLMGYKSLISGQLFDRC